MIRNQTRWLLLLLMLCTVKMTFAAPPEGYNFLPISDALQQAAAEKKPVFLYFGRYGCSTCLKMHNEVFNDSDLHKKLSQNFVLAYVDTESGNRIRLANGERTTEMQFAARNKILGTPTFIYFSDQQQPVMKRAGFQSIQQMTEYSDFISQGHFKTTDLKSYLEEK